MNLVTGLQTLRIVLGEAKTTNDCDVTAAWGDTAVPFALGVQQSLTNGTTPVVVVAAPAPAIQRNVKEIRLHNNDTVPHTVTLQLDNNGTITILDGPTTVAAGDNYLYDPESTSGGATAVLEVTDGTNSVSPTTEIYFKNALVTNLGSGEAQVQITDIINPDGALPDGNGVSITLNAGSGVGGGVSGGIYALSGDGASLSPIVLQAGLQTGFSKAGPQIYLGTFNAFVTSGYAIGSYGGYVFITGHNADATAPGGPGGLVKLATGNASGTGNGGGIFGVYLGTASDPTGLPGQIKVNSDPSIMSTELSWLAGQALNGRTIFTATRPIMVTAIIARLDAANGSAATMAVYKAGSGTAFSGGTLLSSTSVDLNGTPNANQTLTLSTTLTDLQLAIGDSLGLVESGALSLSGGCITVHFTPQ